MLTKIRSGHASVEKLFSERVLQDMPLLVMRFSRFRLQGTGRKKIVIIRMHARLTARACACGEKVTLAYSRSVKMRMSLTTQLCLQFATLYREYFLVWHAKNTQSTTQF